MDGLEALAIGTVVISLVATLFAWLGSRSFDRKYPAKPIVGPDEGRAFPGTADATDRNALRHYTFPNAKAGATNIIVGGGVRAGKVDQRNSRI